MATPLVNIFDVGDYDEQIRRAAQMLRDGQVVVLPTETVYGAAALLSQGRAINRLKSLRPDGAGKPLTVHLADRSEALKFLDTVGDLGKRMMRKLWPGPVGLMFDVPEARRRQVAAEQGVAETDLYNGSAITLRCPDHIVATDVIAQTGGTVVAVRAGIAAAQPAQRADLVAQELDGKVDLVLDAGPTRYSKPSTIVKVKQNSYEIVRAGVYDE